MVRNRHTTVLRTVCVHIGEHDGEDVIIKDTRKRKEKNDLSMPKTRIFYFPLRTIFAEIPHFVYAILCLSELCVQPRIFVSGKR